MNSISNLHGNLYGHLVCIHVHFTILYKANSNLKWFLEHWSWIIHFGSSLYQVCLRIWYSTVSVWSHHWIMFQHAFMYMHARPARATCKEWRWHTHQTWKIYLVYYIYMLNVHTCIKLNPKILQNIAHFGISFLFHLGIIIYTFLCSSVWQYM